jgi:AraC family transcriptional regulator
VSATPVQVDMGGGFATVASDGEILLRSADVNGFTVAELEFPGDYVQPELDPDLPYLAVVTHGGMEKTFRRRLHFAAGSALTMPAGARHGARFGPTGARVVIVKVRDRRSPLAASLDRLVELHGRGLSWLAARLAAELRATDAAAPLAAEGIALELLAAATRERTPTRDRAPGWLTDAEELLRARLGAHVGLSELAQEVGVRPIQLARGFRARHGVSVGDYGRRVRVEWAASEIARGDRSLAEVAAEAGFADQSHFTRLFKRYVGTTPGRYRAFQSR